MIGLRLTVTVPVELTKEMACIATLAGSIVTAASVTMPLALTVPVPDIWLGEAASALVFSVPPFEAPKPIDPAPPLIPTTVKSSLPVAWAMVSTVAPLVMFSVPWPAAPT